LQCKKLASEFRGQVKNVAVSEVKELYKLCQSPATEPATETATESATESADEPAALTPRAIAALAAERAIALDTLDCKFARKDANPVRRAHL
jgi:hypothetical protein